MNPEEVEALSRTITAHFKDKTGIYKESGKFCRVNVDQISVDDWGISLTLRITDALQAVFIDEDDTVLDEDDLKYTEVKSEYNTVFGFSGAWDIVSWTPQSIHVPYVNGQLKTNPKIVALFDNREKDYYKMWVLNNSSDY